MEFGIEKCFMLIMLSGKRHITEGIELAKQERIRMLEEKKITNTWEYWKWPPSKRRWKDEIRNEYLGRPRNFHETKLCRRNLIKGINIWAIFLVRYSGKFLKGLTSERWYIQTICVEKSGGTRRRKWTRRHEFKSWTRLIAFYIALGKGMNPIILPLAKGK